MLDARLTLGKSLVSDFEVAEHRVKDFLQSISALPLVGEKLATCDVWLHYLSDKEFVSPSPLFRLVSPLNGDHQIPTSEGMLPIKSVFEREFESGRLQPRPFGKTRHMIANKRAIVINQSDNQLRSTFWSSSHNLDIGTFIGVPFIFRPTGTGGISFVSALYVRLIMDVEAEISKKIVAEILRLMGGSTRGVFEPLLQTWKSKGFTVMQYTDDERGVWYEVTGKRKFIVSQKRD